MRKLTMTTILFYIHPQMSSDGNLPTVHPPPQMPYMEQNWKISNELNVNTLFHRANTNLWVR